jgi:hypothetical protein
MRSIQNLERMSISLHATMNRVELTVQAFKEPVQLSHCSSVGVHRNSGQTAINCPQNCAHSQLHNAMLPVPVPTKASIERETVGAHESDHRAGGGNTTRWMTRTLPHLHPSNNARVARVMNGDGGGEKADSCCMR